MNYQPSPQDQKVYGMIMYIFTLILFLLFLIFKLTGVIAWSWLWVSCPLWGPLALGLALALLGIRPPQ